MLAIMGWTAVISTLFFLIMERLGKFRIDQSIELIGLDIAEMGGLSNDLLDKIRRELVMSPQTSFH